MLLFGFSDATICGSILRLLPEDIPRTAEWHEPVQLRASIPARQAKRGQSPAKDDGPGSRGRRLSVSGAGEAGQREGFRSFFPAPELLALPPLWWHDAIMEKQRPTYDLDAIKLALGSVGTLAMTTSALRDALALGFDRGGVVETIACMDRRMFYKSMTTFADHRVWQDVYLSRRGAWFCM